MPFEINALQSRAKPFTVIEGDVLLADLLAAENMQSETYAYLIILNQPGDYSVIRLDEFISRAQDWLNVAYDVKLAELQLPKPTEVIPVTTDEQLTDILERLNDTYNSVFLFVDPHTEFKTPYADIVAVLDNPTFGLSKAASSGWTHLLDQATKHIRLPDFVNLAPFKSNIASEAMFSLGYPARMRAQDRYSIWVYAYPKELETVVKEELAGKIANLENAGTKDIETTTQIKNGTPITVSVETEALIGGILFEPKTLIKTWDGGKLRFEFDIKADSALVGQPVIVRAAINVGGVEISSFRFSIEVVAVRRQFAKQPIEEQATVLTAEPYESVIMAQPQELTQSVSSPCVLIVTVTRVEAEAVLNLFAQAAQKPWERWHIGDKIYYKLGTHGGVPICMVQSGMGSGTAGGALLTVIRAISDLHPRAIIMSGIAFGLRPASQQLTDILVASYLQCYEPQKVDENLGKISRGERIRASDALVDRFTSADLDWNGAKRHFGLVLSGEKLVNSQAFLKELLGFEPEAIGGEMEGSGLYAAARDAKVDWILIKAICDWGDGTKNSDSQKPAALNAAQFVLHGIQLGGWN